MSNGAIVLDTPESIELYRMMVIVRGMMLENKGMKLTRGPSCYTIARKQYGLKGNKESLLQQMTALCEAQKNKK